ncbi:MAG TPA: PAS domain S-box protein [Polyangia bacterium]|nr:PAS domain S-box protein [Polyangia bacterium]
MAGLRGHDKKTTYLRLPGGRRWDEVAAIETTHSPWRAEGPHQLQLFQAAFEAALDAILIADDDTTVVEANPAACALLGVAHDQLIGRRLAEFTQPEFSLAALWRGLRAAGDLRGRYPLRRADGEVRDVEFSARANVLPGRHLAVLRDLTEQTASDRARTVAERRLRTVISLAPIILVAVDANGIYTLLEGQGLERLGLRPGELLGQSVFSRVGASPELRQALHRAMKGERVELEFSWRDGLFFDCTFVPVRDAFGAQAGVIGVVVDVSSRKAAERALRASEARFRALIEKSHDAISLLDAELREVYQSPAAERILGYSLEEARRMTWQDFTEPADWPEVQRAIGTLLTGPGATVTLEFRARHKDGRRRWLEVTGTNLLGYRDVDAIVTNYRDVTERKALERTHHEFFSMALDLMVIAGTDGRFRHLNPAWETTLGWSREELTSRPWRDFIHPDDRAATAREEARLAAGERTIRFQNRYRCKDGSYRDLQWSAVASPDEELIYATARDITDQRAAAERDRLLFAASPIPMWLVDLETLRFVEVNDAAVATYGYSRAEFFTMAVMNLIADEGEDRIRRITERVLSEGTLLISGRRHRKKSGELLDVDITGHRIDAGGRPAVLCTVVDLTRRLQAEEALRDSERRYRRIVDNVSDGIWMYDAQGTIGFANPRMAQILGTGVERLVGRSIFDFMNPASIAAARAALAPGARKGGDRREMQLRRPDGSEVWVSMHQELLVDANGRFESALALVADIDEQRRAEAELRRTEEQLRQAQKMEAVGNLAGGIAHDFNNVLSVVLSFAVMILDKLKPSDPMRAEVEEIRKAGLRATQLTRQLLAFGRKQVLQPAVLEVNQVLTDLELMLRRVLGEDVELAIVRSPDAGKVHVDPGQLEQVIMNLIVNARDAMPNGGSLTIETGSLEVEKAGAVEHVGVLPGSYVMIAVSDTGVGMDPATKARAFEPFFTTKEKGKGTGLGLSTAYGIVQQSGGYISIYSEPGRGSTFKIYLPRTDRVEAGAPGTRHPAVTLKGTETVLIVEDEPPVRNIMRTILRQNGYQVLEAENGGEAFLLCEQTPDPIHLLITDVVMPRMNGRQVAERLNKLRPEMKVLYVSGYTENALGQQGVVDRSIAFLPKPILPDALLRKVRDVLDG